MEWDDLRVFLAVAQAGSSRRAAHALGLSQPTVGRRLTHLERAIGGRLFVRTQDGHQLTELGHDLLPLVQTMAEAATAAGRRCAAEGHQASVVRVAAGEWVARFLAPHLSGLARRDQTLTVELVESHQEPDLDRHEADVFIRHGLPARGRLIRIGLGTMAAAVYGARPLVEAEPASKTDARWRACRWVAYDAPHEHYRSMAWLTQQMGDRRPQIRASRFSLQLEAVRSAVGLGILPCFVGDADPTLVRLTVPIDELAADYWLLVHPDLKTAARVRLAMEWIRATFKESWHLLQGQRNSSSETRGRDSG